MLCLEDLSALMCFAGMEGEEKSFWPNSCIPEGKTRFADGIGAEMLALLTNDVKVSSLTGLPEEECEQQHHALWLL